MRVELVIDDSWLDNARLTIAEAAQPVQNAMAERLFEITRSNFGATGIDRPAEWVPLSPDYAKRVKRDYATLHLSGDLESSVQWDGSDPDAAVVWTDCPYAGAHQWGRTETNLPARPFFPVTEGGDLTDFTEQEIINVAQDKLAEILG